MAGMTDTTTVSEGGYTVTSTNETAEQISAILTPATKDTAVSDKPDLSKAGSELGKKGGEASAAKRAEAAKERADAEKETPEPAAEPVSEEPAGEDAEKLGKPRHDPKARMLEATRQAAEAKRELERERAERARLAAEVEQLRASKTPPAEQPKAAPDADAEPQEGDYGEYKDYVKAVSRYEFKQAQREAAKRQEERAYHEGIGHAVDTFIGRMDEAEKSDHAYKDKVAAIASELRPSFTRAPGEKLGPIHVITDEIISSEHAPALTLHLAEHPEDYQRLKALRTPLEIQLAIAKLEARIEVRSDAAPTATAPKTGQSMALPPVRPVAGSPHAADPVPGDDASYEAHKRYWNAKDKAVQR